MPATAGECETTASRPRDPLFDAIAEVAAAEPATNGPLIGKARSALSAADPPYSCDEVWEFGRRFHELCPWAARDGRARPTVPELMKFIAGIRCPPVPVQARTGGVGGRQLSRGEQQDEYFAKMAADALGAPPQ